MDYTTEMIRAMGQQVVELLKETLKKEAETPGIQAVETQIREIVRQIGAAAFGQYLSSQSVEVEPSIPCPCGGELQYQRQREAQIISVFGPVRYQRSYYAGCTCGKGQAPLDQKLGLQPGSVSAGLAELLALGGIEFAFEQGRRWLEKYLLFSVSENTVRRATEDRGGRRAAQEEEWRKQSQTESWLQERQRQTGPVPQRLYGSMDAAKARIEPRCPEEKAQREETFRDLKVGCWYELETVPLAQRSQCDYFEEIEKKEEGSQG